MINKGFPLKLNGSIALITSIGTSSIVILSYCSLPFFAFPSRTIFSLINSATSSGFIKGLIWIIVPISKASSNSLLYFKYFSFSKSFKPQIKLWKVHNKNMFSIVPLFIWINICLINSTLKLSNCWQSSTI